jgi:hypothetical protein
MPLGLVVVEHSPDPVHIVWEISYGSEPKDRFSFADASNRQGTAVRITISAKSISHE